MRLIIRLVMTSIIFADLGPDKCIKSELELYENPQILRGLETTSMAQLSLEFNEEGFSLPFSRDAIPGRLF